MRAPSLLAQCLPGLLPQDRGGVSALSEKDLQLPTPAVEIIPSKVFFSLSIFIIIIILGMKSFFHFENGVDSIIPCYANSLFVSFSCRQ
jgi:hypothetical protein